MSALNFAWTRRILVHVGRFASSTLLQQMVSAAGGLVMTALATRAAHSTAGDIHSRAASVRRHIVAANLAAMTMRTCVDAVARRIDFPGRRLDDRWPLSRPAVPAALRPEVERDGTCARRLRDPPWEHGGDRSADCGGL